MNTFNKNTLASAVGVAALALSVSAPVQAEEGVTISGWINEALIYFDDGVGSDVVQASDNGTTLGSRITFAGNTDVAAGINAGFEVILEPLSNNTPLIFSNQSGIADVGSGGPFDETTGAGIGVLGSSVNVGGAFGKFTVGLQSMPTDNIAVLADPSLTLWSSISPVFRGNGFNIQGTGAGFGAGAAGVVWGSFLGCLTAPELQGVGGIGLDCNGIYRNGVRYDLPTFVENLNIAVSYANDDVYDVAAKYNTQIGRVNTILHLGYAQNNGPSTGGNAAVQFYDSADNFQAQLGLMDPQTGLFGTFAYQFEDADLTAAGRAINYGDDTDALWLKVGVKRQFNSLGDTSFDFQYGRYSDQYGALGAVGVTGSDVDRIGFAVNQYFGSNLIIYGAYENLSLDVEGPAATQALFAGDEDLDIFSLGLTYFF
ncbi:MAG: porin [Gammaproteobacteria bacterium]